LKFAGLNFLPRLDAQGKTLGNRRGRNPWFGVAPATGFLQGVENIPKPKLAIAAEIKLARSNAADRHPDKFEFTPAQDFRRAACEQRFHPFR
jgi:hypothetical protein